LNVALFETKEVKVLEQGAVFFKDLVQVRGKYGLDKWAFEVQRHGAAKDPKTTYSILPERQLTPEEQRAFQALPVHDLGKLYAGTPASGGTNGTTETGGFIDAKTAQSITVVLKALPREAVDRFCTKFGVTRIRELPAAALEKAIAYLDALESEFGAAKAEAAADPFA
jgi:hypothetical protein